MKIFKTFTVLLLMLLLAASVFALQRFTILGRVINAQTCEGIPDLRITLIHQDNGMVAEVLTDSKGKFKKTFTLIGMVKVIIDNPDWTSFDNVYFNRFGNTDIGIVPLISAKIPITQVCPEIENTPVGKELKKLIVVIPDVGGEKELSAKYLDAKTSIAIGDHESAIPILIGEEKGHPDNFAVKFYLGLCYHKTEKYDLALQKWEKALTILPDRYILLSNMSKSWEKKGNNQKAAELYQQYAEKLFADEKRENAPKEEAFFMAGNFWYNAGNNDKYFEAFSKVLEINDKNGDAWYYVGLYYFASSKNDKALEALNKALENNVGPANKDTVVALIASLKPVK